MDSRGNLIMRKGQVDISKKQRVIEAQEEKIINTNVYQSQRNATANYEKKVEQLTVRLPHGSREILNDYISKSNKYNSVNAMIKDLLETEIGKKLD